MVLKTRGWDMPLQGTVAKRTENRDPNKYSHITVHSSVFTVARRWEWHRSLPMDEQTNPMWCEYYTAIKTDHYTLQHG